MSCPKLAAPASLSDEDLPTECSFLYLCTQLAIPASVADEDLLKVAAFRGRGRLPVSVDLHIIIFTCSFKNVLPFAKFCFLCDLVKLFVRCIHMHLLLFSGFCSRNTCYDCVSFKLKRSDIHSCSLRARFFLSNCFSDLKIIFNRALNNRAKTLRINKLDD